MPTKVVYGGLELKEVQAYKLKKDKIYKIINIKTKNKKVLFKGTVVKNYKDYIIFNNGIYKECFSKADLTGSYIKVEEAA